MLSVVIAGSSVLEDLATEFLERFPCAQLVGAEKRGLRKAWSTFRARPLTAVERQLTV